jgi:hypothetical protein
MIVSSRKVEAVYRKVKLIKEHMQAHCLAPNRAKLSVEDLQWCISDMYNLKIEKKEVAFEGEYVRGLVERYESSARILVRAGQGEEWMRFSAVKELCHLAIDEREDWSPRGHETIQCLLLEESLDNAAEQQEIRKLADTKAQSEKLAEIAAAELMYPFEYRGADLQAIEARKTTLKAIAIHFHVPEYVIGTSLHPNRMQIAQLGWEMANK